VVLIWKKFLTDKKEKVMAKIQITQVRSSIGSTVRQKATLKALGLRKIRQTVEHENVPEIAGMVDKVKHLVKVTETNN
jgi:large subunit ribosomal protein L30